MVCFHCGAGLNKWEPQDNPWEEHVKWKPNCEYLRLVKGEEFIRDHQQKIQQKRRALFSELGGAVNGETSSPSPQIGPNGAWNTVDEEIAKLREELLCRICYETKANVVYIPCGHITCGTCAVNTCYVKYCPVCRASVTSCVQIFCP